MQAMIKMFAPKTGSAKIAAIALAAMTVSMAAALPAAAQNYGPSHGPSHGGPRHPTPSYQNAGYGSWQSISQRQVNLDRRIDQGVRNGSLNRREAVRLRSELNSLVRLEANYRRDGLNQRERADLDRRFDRLSAQIRIDRNDHRRG